VSEREREPKKNKKKCVLVYLLWHICLVFMTCISVLSFMAYECFYFLINCFQLSHVGDRNLTSLLTSYLISRDKLGMKIQSLLSKINDGRSLIIKIFINEVIFSFNVFVPILIKSFLDIELADQP